VTLAAATALQSVVFTNRADDLACSACQARAATQTLLLLGALLLAGCADQGRNRDAGP
jgi:hypothetical protein